MLHIFNHTIKPILLYGSEVWGIDLGKTKKGETTNNVFEKNLDNNPLAQLELKFYKRMLQVKRNTATLAIRGELGTYPITIEAICRSFKFLNSIHLKDNAKLITVALQENINQAKHDKQTWYHKISTLANHLKISHISNATSKQTLKTYTKHIEKQIQQLYRKYWHEQLNLTTSKNIKKGGNKLRTYNQLTSI